MVWRPYWRQRLPDKSEDYGGCTQRGRAIYKNHSWSFYTLLSLDEQLKTPWSHKGLIFTQCTRESFVKAGKCKENALNLLCFPKLLSIRSTMLHSLQHSVS